MLDDDSKDINDPAEIEDQTEQTEAEMLGFTKPAKKDSRGRSWMLTLPADEYDQAEVEEKLGKYDAYIGQLEEGSKKDANGEGYKHWQLYLEHENPVRFSALRNLFPRGHFEMRQSSVGRCVAYVTKEDTRVGEIISHGEIEIEDQQGRRTDLEEMRQKIIEGQRYEELIMNDARAIRNFASLKEFQGVVDAETFGAKDRPDIQAHYISGASGVGKTSAIKAKHGSHYRQIHSVDDYSKNSHHWDFYAAQPVLLLDEFESNWSLQMMRRMLDIYSIQLPARYANKFAAWEIVYVLSNEPYSWQWKDSGGSDRAKAAVRRRFTSIGEMQKDGSVIYERYDWKDLEEPLVLSYEEAFGMPKPDYLKKNEPAAPNEEMFETLLLSDDELVS